MSETFKCSVGLNKYNKSDKKQFGFMLQTFLQKKHTGVWVSEWLPDSCLGKSLV